MSTSKGQSVPGRTTIEILGSRLSPSHGGEKKNKIKEKVFCVELTPKYCWATATTISSAVVSLDNYPSKQFMNSSEVHLCSEIPGDS